ncbi:heme-binding protein [Paraburkholderia xenovorans]|uniref:GlcG/HbpS family heme-binding protein n=1 Tax=Paraburkholderia xenovorans TaxID=36873 RepID=UPI0038B85F4A
MLLLDHAVAVVAAAIQYTRECGLPPVSVTIVDAAAYPLSFARMDGCFLGAIDVANRKARTAALFRANSDEVGANFRPGAPAFSLENTNGGLVGFGGGVVLRDANGHIVGAIGVSGATMEQDQEIAEVAARRLTTLA